jgi:hypothetical protein
MHTIVYVLVPKSRVIIFFAVSFYHVNDAFSLKDRGKATEDRMNRIESNRIESIESLNLSISSSTVQYYNEYYCSYYVATLLASSSRLVVVVQ